MILVNEGGERMGISTLLLSRRGSYIILCRTHIATNDGKKHHLSAEFVLFYLVFVDMGRGRQSLVRGGVVFLPDLILLGESDPLEKRASF